MSLPSLNKVIKLKLKLNSNDKPSSKSYWLSDWRCLSFTFILKFRIVNIKLNFPPPSRLFVTATANMQTFFKPFSLFAVFKAWKVFRFFINIYKNFFISCFVSAELLTILGFRPSAFLEAPSFAVPFVEHAQVHSFKYWVDISIFSHLVLPPATYMKKVAIRSYLSCRGLF